MACNYLVSEGDMTKRGRQWSRSWYTLCFYSHISFALFFSVSVDQKKGIDYYL